MVRYTHCTPLECGDWTHHDSIDIALLCSAGIKFVAIYRHCTGSTIALAIHSLDLI